MAASNMYLFCFAFGLLWAIASLLLGSFHVHGHAHGAHLHSHPGHIHAGHAAHGAAKGSPASKFWGEFLNLHSIAIFLAWFGGCGFLMTRHSRSGLALVLLVSILGGLVSAFVVAWFLHFLHGKEHELDPFDYDMVGVLGRVSSSIRNGGTGEILYTRDGARASACARSEEGKPIDCGVEVVVTRYEQGVAYVRTWDSLAERDVR